MSRRGGEEGGREGIRGPGQTTSEVHAPSRQSSSTGTTGGWREGELTMIGMEASLPTRVVDAGVGVGGGGGVGSRR